MAVPEVESLPNQFAAGQHQEHHGATITGLKALDTAVEEILFVVEIANTETKTCGLHSTVLLEAGGTLNLPETLAARAGSVTILDPNYQQTGAWATGNTATVVAEGASTIGDNQNGQTGTQTLTINSEIPGLVLTAPSQVDADWTVHPLGVLSGSGANSISGYSVTSDIANRSLNANTVTLAELADIVATLIKDLGGV